MAMTKAEQKDLQEIKSRVDAVLAEMRAVKWLVPIMAATNGVLVIVGLSLVGTLIAKLFGWV